MCHRTAVVMLSSPRSILKGFLAKGFLTSVAALSDGLVSSTLEVYGKVAREMLPTPSRPHYTFNLRDIGKVVQVTCLSVCLTCWSAKAWIRATNSPRRLNLTSLIRRYPCAPYFYAVAVFVTLQRHDFLTLQVLYYCSAGCDFLSPREFC